MIVLECSECEDFGGVDAPYVGARMLGLALHYTWDFECSIGKRLLWTAFLSMILSCDVLRERNAALGMLCHAPVVMKCDAGIVVCTCRDWQMNVNILVPVTESHLMPLFKMLLEHVELHNPLHAIDFTHVRRLFPIGTFDKAIRLRRRIPLVSRCSMFSQHAQHLNKLKNVVRSLHVSIAREGTSTSPCVRVACTTASGTLQGRVPARIIDAPAELGRCKPVTRFESSDATDVEYWHRCDDGVIVAFFAPLVSIVPPLSTLNVMANVEQLLPHMPAETIGKVLRGVFAKSFDDVLACMSDRAIPEETRRLYICLAKKHFGITDALLSATAQCFSASAIVASELSSACMSMGKILLMSRDCVPAASTAIAMAEILVVVKDQCAWQHWMFHSAFVYATILRMDEPALRLVVAKYAPLACVLITAFFCSMDAWSLQDRSRVAFAVQHLLPMGGLQMLACSAKQTLRKQIAAVADKLDVLESEAEKNADEVIRASTAASAGVVAATKRIPPSSASVRVRSAAAAPCVSDAAVPAPVRCVSHQRVCDALAARIGLACELVGSGAVFARGNDADVVGVVPRGSETLAHAYERLARELAWETRISSGTGVVILKGCMMGVDVDLQLWHGDTTTDATRAEEETRKAVRFTRRVLCETSTATRDRIRIVHELANATGLKGPRTGRLPGIAVTALSIALLTRDVLSDDVATTVTLFVRRVRDVLCVAHPSVDVECPHGVGGGDARRPESPLAVYLFEKQLVTNQMTTCTTRCLLDLVAHLDASLEGDMTFAACAAAAREWRRASLLPFACLAPLDASVHASIATYLAQLDGHPLIDVLHVEDAKDCICVSGRLNADVDERYAIRPDDAFVVAPAEDSLHPRGYVAHVRAGRSTLLMASRTRRAQAHEVTGTHGALFVPRAPHITCDVASAFATAWRLCSES